MEKYELLLTQQAEENIQESFDTLMTAARDIAAASKNDFERIKGKKWYKRLWELVTFNNDNQMIQARGVGNLAKLNEITMKAIVLVSRQSQDIATNVAESLKELSALREDVDDLYDQQFKLIETVQKIKRGFEAEDRFDELSENQRNIIFAVLYKYAANQPSTEYTGKLLATIRRNSHDTYEDVDYAIIESELTQSSQKILFSILHLYSLLLNTAPLDEKHELFQFVGLSENIKNRIRNRVQEDIKVFGKDQCIEMFDNTAEEYAVFVDEDYIYWCFDGEGHAETVFNEAPKDEPSEIILNEIMHIDADESCTYTKKRIDLKAIVECEGTLVFDDCEIVVDDDEAPKSSIELTGNGAIIFNNCRIFMYYKLSDFLISAAKNTSIHLTNCFLNGCGMFIETTGNCEVDFCRFVHPGVNLLSCKSQEDSHCVVRNSSFYQRHYPSHIEYSGAEEYSSILSGISVIDNCKVERESDCFSHSQYGRKMAFLNSKKVDIRHLTVKNWANCIRADGDNEVIIRVSVFEQCENAISANRLDAENCNFYDCLNSIKTSGNSVVSHCQFYKCCGNSVTSTSRIEVKYCLFDTCMTLTCSGEQSCRDRIIYSNILRTMEDVETKDFYENAIIHISHSKHEKSHSQIVKCRFCNMDLGNSYIIKGNDYVDHKNEILKISDSEFSNCKSLRKDQKIVRLASLKEYHSVSPLVMVTPLLAVKMTIKEFVNIRLANCTGICSATGSIINNGRTAANEFVAREYTASKEKIGCLLEED